MHQACQFINIRVNLRTTTYTYEVDVLAKHIDRYCSPKTVVCNGLKTKESIIRTVATFQGRPDTKQLGWEHGGWEGGGIW